MAALIVPKGSEAALLPRMVKDEFTNAACGGMPADSIPLVKFAHADEQAKSARAYAAMPQSVDSLPEDVDTPECEASETPAQLALTLAAVARPRISAPGQTKPGEGGEAGGGGGWGTSDVSNAAVYQADDVYTPKGTENPVVTALKERSLYKMPLGSGRHIITCPWVHEHVDELDTGATYLEPSDEYPVGRFCCQPSHRDQYHIGQLIKFLDLTVAQARHKAAIRVVAGEMDRVSDAAERVLAARGKHYQSGGLIVSVTVDLGTGDPSIVPTNLQALTKELSVAADWQKYDGRKGDWMRCDPPPRHVGMLYDSRVFSHLPPLVGLARQPYFRESDGELVTQPGYDELSQRYGVFQPSEYPLPAPTFEAAQAALRTLEELLASFRFAEPADRAAALAAIFTAVVRPSLAHAPGFHVRAPVYASGKTYLCELIGTFAGPGQNLKVSYPKTTEEATKSILSLLLTGPAVVEFDDMDTDWTPHGVIKRVFTADKISDRVLGVSKVATVSTRTLFLGSGNNVGPVRDLLRRVLTIHIDPRCATPATLSYPGTPVETVRKDRGRYVSAVLTIIQAWRRAGSPRMDVAGIATYGGAWTDLCRLPLIWLGHPDPATSLFNQISHDPDSEALGTLMTEWRRAYGSAPTTVRKIIAAASDRDYQELADAIGEFPVVDGARINASKLGWLLKRMANRIVDGWQFVKAEADGRRAWAVVPANHAPGTPMPPPPPARGQVGQGVIDNSDEF